ncbi:Fic family protein [Candidatus Saccharibacteria bacterium]|nr:Fic family protein [Candidatus Saccharibacteria bacterium]
MEKYDRKISKILLATGWSQETLAGKIGVSFVTLNSWANGKAEPRETMREKLDLIYAEVMGSEAVDQNHLKALKNLAIAKKATVKKILSDRALLEKITTSLTYHNNATEGSTMTEKDVAAVIYDNKTLRNRTAIEQREAINHQTALYFLLDELSEKGTEFLFTPDLIKSVHLRMMNGIISDAGYYRNHSVRIRGAYVPLANFIKIPELIEKWCNKANAETMDKIELLATSHADFEKIHPFSDGNGRTGRLLLFILALKLGLTPPILRKERHLAYYKYLELLQLKEISDPLEQFIAEEILATSELIQGKF